MSILTTKQELKTQLSNISTRLTMTSIPENALLDGVVKLLNEHLAFNDCHENNEKIYHGSIFVEILSEVELIDEKLDAEVIPKVLLQLQALAEVVIEDYVLITTS